MLVTIFTPTYNRAYIINELYKSLLRQTNSDFEWIVVDDGSSDNTEDLINSFISAGKLDIKYFKVKNGGKHRAINHGVLNANGELFFIVDSDDYLYDNAIERILYHYNFIANDNLFGGICGLKTYFTGHLVGGEFNYNIIDCNSLEFRFKYHIKGDVAEVFKTKILKEYPFPELDNEKFCPEALIWNRIALNYKLRYFNEKIYLCDYLPDGLTAKIIQLRMKSPEASNIYYSELYNMKIPLIQKIKAAINYWRFAFCSRQQFKNKVSQIGLLSLPLLPLGYLFHINDRRNEDSSRYK
ncbi:MAG TPA: glycosyltransferase family A protein [Paludibacter sp.]